MDREFIRAQFSKPDQAPLWDREHMETTPLYPSVKPPYYHNSRVWEPVAHTEGNPLFMTKNQMPELLLPESLRDLALMQNLNGGFGAPLEVYSEIREKFKNQSALAQRALLLIEGLKVAQFVGTNLDLVRSLEVDQLKNGNDHQFLRVTLQKQTDIRQTDGKWVAICTPEQYLSDAIENIVEIGLIRSNEDLELKTCRVKGLYDSIKDLIIMLPDGRKRFKDPEEFMIGYYGLDSYNAELRSHVENHKKTITGRHEMRRSVQQGAGAAVVNVAAFGPIA